MSEQTISSPTIRRLIPLHGWIGIGLVATFWLINWSLRGPRTHWAFFPLWLGYCLGVDALVYCRRGTSLLSRDWRKYTRLFIISAPVWWLFEVINRRLGNWYYNGSELFSSLEYGIWATISFTTVIPAVFGSAELVASFNFLKSRKSGLVILPTLRTTLAVFLVGWAMLVSMLLLPKIFFPFIWLSIYFILEPLNIWLGNRSLAHWTKVGDWRAVIALWGGVLITAFFWEMWNYLSYPKWIYHVLWGGCCKIFEMPLLGYGGYLPFALELFAIYHLVVGLFGEKATDYVQITPD